MDNEAKPENDARDLMSRLKSEVDGLMLQLELGKADAVDFIEQQKEEMRDLIDRSKAAIDEGKMVAGDQASALKQSLDELRLELALGRMESRDALAEQREKIGQAIDSTRRHLEPVENSLKQNIADSGEALKTKLNALALDLGIRAAVAEDELVRTKDAFKEDLRGIKDTLQPAIDGVGESLHEINRQAAEKFKELKNRLSQLFD